jgi:hypothetical protein
MDSGEVVVPGDIQSVSNTRWSHAQCVVDFLEGTTHVRFGVGGLLCGVGAFGWWRIVMRRWAEPPNEANCYTNERNRQSDERGAA